MSKLSHVDVLMLGLKAGLTYHKAEEVAHEACPEYRGCPESKAIRLIKKAVKE